MGDLNGEEADKLDERLWGDDEEEDEDDDSKAEETGPGMDEVIKSPPPRVLAAIEELVLPCPAVYCFSLFLFSFFHLFASLVHTESSSHYKAACPIPPMCSCGGRKPVLPVQLHPSS